MRPTVLIVDDDPAARSIAAAKLGHLADIDLAVDGLDAFERINDKLYDAVIVDLDMPMIDGVELIRILRSRRQSKHVPIIVVSGNENPQVFKRALSRGASATFQKPLPWGDFIPYMRRLIIQKSAVPSETFRHDHTVSPSRARSYDAARMPSAVPVFPKLPVTHAPPFCEATTQVFSSKTESADCVVSNTERQRKTGTRYRLRFFGRVK